MSAPRRSQCRHCGRSIRLNYRGSWVTHGRLPTTVCNPLERDGQRHEPLVSTEVRR